MINTRWYRYEYLSNVLTVFARLFPLPPSRSSDPGHIAGSFLPSLLPVHCGSFLSFFIARRLQPFLLCSTRVRTFTKYNFERYLPTIGRGLSVHVSSKNVLRYKQCNTNSNNTYDIEAKVKNPSVLLCTRKKTNSSLIPRVFSPTTRLEILNRLRSVIFLLSQDQLFGGRCVIQVAIPKRGRSLRKK